jgi:peroxiredoxin
MSTSEQSPAAQPFALLGTDGIAHTLAEQHGRPVLAAFFKTTCPTCMLTFQYLEKMHRTYGPLGLTVWGVSQDPLDDSLAFAREQGVTFPILLDTNWDISLTYGIETVPTTFLFDKEGTVAYAFLSFCKDDINETARLISEQIGAQAAMIAPANDGRPPFRPG